MSQIGTDVAHHAWRLDQREVERHLARRGRRHAFETIQPARTALVVVDMVPFFLEASAYARGIVAPINALAGATRAAGGAVVWVVPSTTETTARDREFYGDEVAERYARSGGEGTPRARLRSELDVKDSDSVIAKTAASAFFPGRSDLPELLERAGIDTVVIAGTVTNVCVESSVRDAATLGYRVILVADACAANNDHDHNATLHVVHRSFGDVRATVEVVELLERGARPGLAR